MAIGRIQTYKTQGRIPTGSGSMIGDLFLTRMMNNPIYKTIITLPMNEGIVTGYCEGPFAFEGRADWKPIADLSNVEDAASAAYNAALAIKSTTMSNASSDDLAQLSFKQIRGTELRWAGSSIPVFQMKLILPSYDARAKQSPMDSVALLMKCVYPEYAATKYAGKMLKAPLGYGIKGEANQELDRPSGGCVSISRGKFFHADNMLIHSVSSSFSQECMVDGYPLYVEVNIQFGPWRMPDYKTAMGWFRLR